MQIEMTGKEDRLSPWKMLIGGFPGAGKTLFASTAPDPLFVFFRENPRIKSIADRHIPHVKVVNDDQATVLEKMQALAVHLELTNDDFKTLVIDTGDELQHALKEARRIQNGGEFTVGDWGWLSDVYRELMSSYIDLDMRVIVLFHLKSASDMDDGHSIRELALQGASKDEAAGWFDVVGALDTYEITNEDGDIETRRVLLTHSSRMYPWIKDHSGNLPRRWELSEGFVGDVAALEEVLNSTEVKAEREVIGEIAEAEGDPNTSESRVVSPEELESHKSPDTPELNKAMDTVQEVIGISEISEPSDEDTKVEDPSEESEEPEEEPTPEPAMQEVELPVGDEPEEPSYESAVTTAPPEETPDYKCEECGEESPEDVAKMSKIRHKRVLCRDHYLKELRGE